jgi:hypothetical protein
MRRLLDILVLLWAMLKSPALGAEALALLESSEHLRLQMPTSTPHATQRVLAMPFAASSVRSCLGPAGFGGFRRKGWYSYM